LQRIIEQERTTMKKDKPKQPKHVPISTAIKAGAVYRPESPPIHPPSSE
jgi:hypothetical protein